MKGFIHWFWFKIFERITKNIKIIDPYDWKQIKIQSTVKPDKVYTEVEIAQNIYKQIKKIK